MQRNLKCSKLTYTYLWCVYTSHYRYKSGDGSHVHRHVRDRPRPFRFRGNNTRFPSASSRLPSRDPGQLGTMNSKINYAIDRRDAFKIRMNRGIKPIYMAS